MTLLDDYALLELPTTATPAQIKQAYLQLLQVWHPDRFEHDPTLRTRAEEKTKGIVTAFGRIKDAPLAEPVVSRTPATASDHGLGEPVVLLARAAVVGKTTTLGQDDGLHAVREGLFLPIKGGACQLHVGNGRLAAVSLRTKRSLGLLAYPVIGTIGIPLPGGQPALAMFDISRNDLVRWFVFDRSSAPHLTCFVYETEKHYIGVTSLDYRAFLQVSDNRKLIRQAERAYEACGLGYTVAKHLLIFRERVYTRDFAAWVYRAFTGEVPHPW